MMQKIDSSLIREVPGHYLKLGIGSVGLLLFCTFLLMMLAGGVASVYAAQWVWQTVYGVGALGGIIIAFFMLSLIRRAKMVMDSFYDNLIFPEPLSAPHAPQITTPQNNIIPPSQIYDGRVPLELGESEAQKRYMTALEIAKLAFASQALTKDGTPVRGKPFQFRRCQELGITPIHADWLSALQLLEQSGAGENLTQSTGFTWHVSNIANVENVLSNYYIRHGYIKYNGKWVKR